MNYLLVENLTKSYGEKLLFEDITFGIDRGQKVALIAKNGTGKTSLLNIIYGLDIPDSGKIVLRNDLKISYLEQNPQFDTGLSIFDILFNSTNQYVKAIRNYNQSLQLIQKDNSRENQTSLDKSTAIMDSLQAWDYDSKVKEILSKLNLDNIHQTVGELSGGQRKKVALARILIDEADLIILDEPTNHLDIQMIEWLEEFLLKQNLSLLVVTHDRYFLDEVCNEIIELEQSNVYRYKGNYSYYLEKKAEREFIEGQEIEKAKNIYRKELDWMRRMPKARSTKQKARIDSFYDIEKTAKKRIEQKPPDFKVKVTRIGRKILEVNNIFKKFDGLNLIENFSYTFKKGERIGVVGPNGSGKSTFFNMIMGLIRPDMGKITSGQTMIFGYYSQEGLKVETGKRVIEIIRDVAEEIPIEKGSMSASQFLFHFGFDYNTQYNYFSNLSGGEKRKLFLLMTLMQNPNFLILDEPTNDLDIYTLTRLEEFLMNFQGCLLIASHDRYFLDKLADHIFVFEGNGKIKDYYSNYTLYRIQKDKENAKIAAHAKSLKISETPPTVKKESNKPTYKQIREFETLESDIAKLETEKNELFEKLSSGESNQEKLKNWSKRITDILTEIDQKTNRWMKLGEFMN